ncbi:MAG: penicillin amidase, partial [Frankiales bacterium]|nr:penicillin amidase [Frankiales bacterium]
SYWLANPAKPLTGFPLIVGDEGTERTLRTRIGLVMTTSRIDGTDGKPGKGFTRQNLQDLVFSDRSYTGEMGRDDVVAMCKGFTGGLAPTSSGTPVDVGNACDVLAAWDRHEDVRSRGSLLWRAFFGGALAAQGGPWVNAFDPADPVHTPNTVNTQSPAVQQAFGDAVASLRASGIDAGAQQGSYQYAQRGKLKIMIPGGPGDPEGQFNAIAVRTTAGKPGLVDPVHGSSFVQVVGWTSSEWPDARTILTYSESDNPSSPHYADQTRLFSSKTWVTERFSPASVKGHAVSTLHLTA